MKKIFFNNLLKSSSFKFDQQFINSVKNILPKSYTKSEVSDDKSVINDIKSESHVQC